LPIAIADREGEVELVLDANDSGGTHIDKHSGTRGQGRAPSRCLQDTAGGRDCGWCREDRRPEDRRRRAEDLVLVPFLRDAPRERWPELILIEDTRGSADRRVRLAGATRLHCCGTQSQNVAYRLDS